MAFQNVAFSQSSSTDFIKIPANIIDSARFAHLQNYLDSVETFLSTPAVAKIQNCDLYKDNAFYLKKKSHSVYSWKLKTPFLKTRLLLKSVQLEQNDSLLFFSIHGEILEAITSKNLINNHLLSPPRQSGIVVQLKDYSQKANLNIVGYTWERALRVSAKLYDFGDSEECQVNINCLEGSNHRDIQKSVVRIFMKIGSSFLWCSGTLMNNTSYNFDPYILTAEHCGLTNNQITDPSDLDFWTFYFNYQSDDCENPISQVLINSDRLTGSKVIANSNDNGGDFGSDFLLLKLNQLIPANFDVFYSGWNRQDKGRPNSGVGIHHPSGDIKKISTYFNSATLGSFGNEADNTHWKVIWHPTANGHGTTETGSSGSPLFDENNLLRGVLTGGGSDCSNTSLPDFYGRLSYSWNSNGATSNRRLDHWLDPNNTGYQALEGAYFTDTIPVYFDQVQMYPNPVINDILFVENLANPRRQIEIYVYDIYGQLLKQLSTVSLVGKVEEYDVSNLANGLYIIRVFDGIANREFKIEVRR